MAKAGSSVDTPWMAVHGRGITEMARWQARHIGNSPRKEAPAGFDARRARRGKLMSRLAGDTAASLTTPTGGSRLPTGVAASVCQRDAV